MTDTGALIGILLVVISLVVFCVYGFFKRIWTNRRQPGSLWSRLMPSTTPILPQQQRQLPRQNFPRRLNRNANSTRPNFAGPGQAAPCPTPAPTIVQIRPTPNAGRPLYQSHSALAKPFPSITPLPEPVQPPIPEHGQPDVTLDLKERMRQVQAIMLDIHRLENESGSSHRQRIQELQRRVVELSDTTAGTTTDTVGQHQIAGVGPSSEP